MGSPLFHELKKQASFFLKDKIRTARLAFTDVTPAQLLTEEATNGNPSVPDARTMGLISRAAFEIDDYWRIVEILHKRLSNFDGKHWRAAYQALLLLEHLLTHGPESTAAEFRSDREVIQELGQFQHVDERGFNWGASVRKACERILQLFDNGKLLKEERDRARRVARGIQGFGSFCQRSSESIRDPFFERCSSTDSLLSSTDKSSIEDKMQNNLKFGSDRDSQKEDLSTWATSSSSRFQQARHTETVQRSLQEDAKVEDDKKESEPLLASLKPKPIKLPVEDHDHPFKNFEHQATVSLLSVT